jgi:alpha-tubulin suppressor-like RCC1 family protein
VLLRTSTIGAVLVLLASACVDVPSVPAADAGLAVDANMDGGGGGNCGTVPTDVSLGQSHGCGIWNGMVYCWGGGNEDGQLGDGTTISHGDPVAVDITGDAISVCAGDRHSCAVTSDGQALCWGDNSSRQLGSGGADKPTPTQIDEQGASFVEIDCGAEFSCARTDAGEVWCWGINTDGQVGSGGAEATLSPTRLTLTGMLGLDLGGQHACAFDSDSVWCWGRNLTGQIGNNTMTEQSTPVETTVPLAVTAVGVGRAHTCAVEAVTGTVYCWGKNTNGQMGNGSAGSEVLEPVASSLSGARDVSVGAHFTCATTVAGGAHCWGQGNFGQLGNGGLDSSFDPVPVTLLGGATATAISSKSEQTCAIRGEGGLICWGENTKAQIGASELIVSQPTLVAVPDGATSVDSFRDFTCARGTFGVSCWGSHFNGQVGDNMFHGRSFSDPYLTFPVPATAMAAGADHACLTQFSGATACWGENSHGELGRGTVGGGWQPMPAAVTGTIAFNGLAAGRNFACGLDSGDEVVCWGDVPQSTTTGTPTVQLQLGLATALDAGDFHGCLIADNNKAACFGLNGLGQLGDMTIDNKNFTAVSIADDAIAIATGKYYSCVATSNETYCFGDDSTGGLGGPAGLAGTPQVVNGVPPLVGLDANDHTCGWTASGALYCWGENSYGQIDSSGPDPHPPVAVTFQGAVADVGVGSNHTCLVDTEGKVWCWGLDFYGVTGSGRTLFFTEPKSLCL